MATKEADLRSLLGDGVSAVMRPIVASASPWFYRNKMEFAFGFERDRSKDADEKGERPPDRVALGLRRRGKFFGVVNLQECFLMCETAPQILAAAREWAADHGLPPYHLRRHRGLLRYLVLREGKRTGQLLAAIVTAPPPDEAEFVKLLDDLAGRLRPAGVTSLLWNVTERQADLAVGDIRRVVYGQDRFEEVLAGVKFNLSFHAFFQPNVELAEKLIGKARSFLGGKWPMMVDLYSGVGGLTLTMADLADRAIGVELEAPAVDDARRNARTLGLGHCQFVAEKALTFLRRFSNYSFMSDKWAVVVDPPRSGMHPKMPGQLARLAPPVIVYVSCNPKMLAGDLKALSGSYRLEEAVPYDFFPHTPHVEVAAKLTRK